MAVRALELAVLVAGDACEEVQAVLRARGGDVEEARGLDVLCFALEPGEVAVGGLLIRAGGFDGGEEQTNPPARRRLASPLDRGVAGDDVHRRNNFIKKQKVGVAAAGALVEAGDDDGAEL